MVSGCATVSRGPFRAYQYNSKMRFRDIKRTRAVRWWSAVVLGVWIIGCSADDTSVQKTSDALASVAHRWRATAHGSDKPAAKSPAKRLSAEQMSERLAPRLSRSTEGLSFKRRKDGLTTVDFQGRFTHVTLAKRMPDGSIQTRCVDQRRALDQWLGSRSVRSKVK
jgi:hypothetical protein